MHFFIEYFHGEPKEKKHRNVKSFQHFHSILPNPPPCCYLCLSFPEKNHLLISTHQAVFRCEDSTWSFSSQKSRSRNFYCLLLLLSPSICQQQTPFQLLELQVLRCQLLMSGISCLVKSKPSQQSNRAGCTCEWQSSNCMSLSIASLPAQECPAFTAEKSGAQLAPRTERQASKGCLRWGQGSDEEITFPIHRMMPKPGKEEREGRIR